MKLGEKIRKLREQKGLSQKEVATYISLDRSQYSRIETDKSEPTVATLERIAKALGVKVNYFFEEVSLEITAFDKSLVEKVKLIDELDEKQKTSIFTFIDTALTNKRLKDTLNSALQITQ